MSMTFNLYLVRHGETYLNKYDRMQGWSDAPLTTSGIEDAQAAGERLQGVQFAQAYSSDLSRARDTARAILEQNRASTGLTEPEQLAAFREVFFGGFEALKGPKVAAEVGQQLGLANIKSYGDLTTQLTMNGTMDAFKELDPYHDAEDADEFWTRVQAGFEYIRQHAQDGDNILLVAHGTLIRNLVSQYESDQAAEEKPVNGMISVWQVSDQDLSLKAYNDTTTIW
ncbi:histidine phosphatase family protein [Weissella halotolerans]|uniref:Phosphoglycerate mutase n=1 Tax=Weissella halotolerans DSM 20190 TaxID=1123500 RepID=A0A0R2G643_9LACO|nr:histidine phosphatase family protein [Weissella halotolerans]KRN32244.1 phosphoglycerate mutase [Weissella halotolerans DSM 20190]